VNFLINFYNGEKNEAQNNKITLKDNLLHKNQSYNGNNSYKILILLLFHTLNYKINVKIEI